MPKRRRKRIVKALSGKGEPNAKDWHKGVARRVQQIAGDYILTDLASMTGANAETIRRYRNTGRMPIQFLTAFCLAFKLDPRWVLFGTTSPKGLSTKRKR